MSKMWVGRKVELSYMLSYRLSLETVGDQWRILSNKYNDLHEFYSRPGSELSKLCRPDASCCSYSPLQKQTKAVHWQMAVIVSQWNYIMSLKLGILFEFLILNTSCPVPSLSVSLSLIPSHSYWNIEKHAHLLLTQILNRLWVRFVPWSIIQFTAPEKSPVLWEEGGEHKSRIGKTELWGSSRCRRGTEQIGVWWELLLSPVYC